MNWLRSLIRPALVGLLSATAGLAHAQWQLVWSDEFNGAAGTVPDAKTWNYDLGNAENSGWGNHELEYYTDHARNAQMDAQAAR